MPALEVDATGETVASVFQRRHVWLPAGSGARLEPRAGTRAPALSRVVDADVYGNWDLQSYFGALDATDPENLRGCCTTMTLLIVWLCLRFDCREPQLMVNALRCVASLTAPRPSSPGRARKAVHGASGGVHRFPAAVAGVAKRARGDDVQGSPFPGGRRLPTNHRNVMRWLKVRTELDLKTPGMARATACLSAVCVATS